MRPEKPDRALYRGATVGLVLAITGMIARAVVAVVRRPAVVVAGATSPVSAVPDAGASAAPAAVAESGLTTRELEVLRAIVTGARTPQIALDLGIAERTVKAHLASIYQKLGVESRAAAVAIAVRRRWVGE